MHAEEPLSAGQRNTPAFDKRGGEPSEPLFDRRYSFDDLVEDGDVVFATKEAGMQV
jgi:hypothetical protein